MSVQWKMNVPFRLILMAYTAVMIGLANLMEPLASAAGLHTLTGKVDDSADAKIPDIQIDGKEVVKSWVHHRLIAGEQAFDKSGFARVSSPTSWAGTIIYQVVTDRFNNGDPSNDILNMPEAQRRDMAAGDYSGLPDWRHGGDLHGIVLRLGYLKDLGVQTLWITPILMNTGGYHGYCTSDLTKIDPSFGTAEELRQLVAEAHNFGLWVVLDVVINHMCDDATTYTTEPDHEYCAELWAETYWKGTDRGDVSLVGMNFSSRFFPPFRTEAFFNRCGPNDAADTSGETATAIFGDFTSEMFDYNTMDADFQEIFTGLLKYWVAYADLDGFRLDAAKHVTNDFIAYFSTEVRNYARTLGKENFLIIGEEASKSEVWKAMALGRMMSDPANPQIHGNIPETVTDELVKLRKSYLSNPSFGAPGLTSLYNFNMSGTARDALRCEEVSSTIKDYFSSFARRVLLKESVPQPGAEKDAQLWTCIELHDWPRFLGIMPDKVGKLKAALTWLLTAPGSPILYYGVEQAFDGNCPAKINLANESQKETIRQLCESGATETYGAHPDSLKRQDMFKSGPWRLGSAIPEVDKTAYIGKFGAPPLTRGPEDWKFDPMLPRNHRIYQHVKKLNAFRQSCPPIKEGGIVWHDAADVGCGFLAYSRFLAQKAKSDLQPPSEEVIVLINPGGVDNLHVQKSLFIVLNDTVVRRKIGEKYVNAMNNSEAALIGSRGGLQTLEFQDGELTLQPGEVMVLVQERNLLPFDNDIGISLYDPNTRSPENETFLEGRLHPTRKWVVVVLAGLALISILCCLAYGLSFEATQCAAKPNQNDASDSESDKCCTDDEGSSL